MILKEFHGQFVNDCVERELVMKTLFPLFLSVLVWWRQADFLLQR